MDIDTQKALDDILETVSSAYADDSYINGVIGETYSGLHRMGNSTKENQFKWLQPANVGNTDPKAVVPHGTYAWLPGDPATFTCKGAPANEDNFYFYMPLPIPSSLPKAVVDERTHTISDLTGWQALEWQQQLTFHGATYNMAWQFSITSGVRTFNFNTQKWQSVLGISMPDFSKGVRTKCVYTLKEDGTTIHESIEINGVKYTVGTSQKPNLLGKPDKFTISEQVDPKKGGYCVLSIGNIELRYV